MVMAFKTVALTFAGAVAVAVAMAVMMAVAAAATVVAIIIMAVTLLTKLSIIVGWAGVSQLRPEE